MKHSNRPRAILFVPLPLAFAFLPSLGLSACTKSPPSSPESCGAYANLLCEKADPDSSQCEEVKIAADLLPPAACAVGLTDIAYATKRLAAAQKPCNDAAQKVCAGVGPDSDACKGVTIHYKRLRPEACEWIAENLPDVITRVRKHYQGLDVVQRPAPGEEQTALERGQQPSSK